MARIPEIVSREELPEDKRHVFDAIMASRGRVGMPFTLLLHSPEVADRVAHLGAYVRFDNTLAPVDQELAILTAVRECDCAVEWAGHVRAAARVGIPEAVVDVIAHRHPLDGLSAEQALIVRYSRELLIDHRVSDATFEAARARLGDQGVVDLTATIGYYAMLACILNAFGAEPPADAPQLP